MNGFGEGMTGMGEEVDGVLAEDRAVVFTWTTCGARCTPQNSQGLANHE